MGYNPIDRYMGFMIGSLVGAGYEKGPSAKTTGASGLDVYVANRLATLSFSTGSSSVSNHGLRLNHILFRGLG